MPASAAPRPAADCEQGAPGSPLGGPSVLPERLTSATSSRLTNTRIQGFLRISMTSFCSILKKKKVLQDQRERRRNTAPGADTTHTWSRLTDRKTLRAAHEGAVFTRDSALRFFRFSLMSMHYLQNVEKCGTSGHLGPCVHVCVPWDSVLLSACTSPDSGGRRPRTAASRAARRAGCRETGPQARARPS